MKNRIFTAVVVMSLLMLFASCAGALGITARDIEVFDKTHITGQQIKYKIPNDLNYKGIPVVIINDNGAVVDAAEVSNLYDRRLFFSEVVYSETDAATIMGIKLTSLEYKADLVKRTEQKEIIKEAIRELEEEDEEMS